MIAEHPCCMAKVAEIDQIFSARNKCASLKRSTITRRTDVAPRFDICLLLTIGGRIANSSSAFVWTERIETGCHPSHLLALFVAGQDGVVHALQDEEPPGWHALHGSSGAPAFGGRRASAARRGRVGRPPDGDQG